MSEQELKVAEDLYAALRDAYAGGGWLGLLPVALVGLVNVYRLPIVQGLLPAKVQWGALAWWAQPLVAFSVAAVPVLATKLVAGSSFVAALVLAVSAGVAAVVSHKVILKPFAGTGVATAAAASLPTSVSRPLSLIVPIDMERVAEAKAAKAGEVK